MLQQPDIRRNRHFIQCPIHAVTDAHIIFERLDVDIGSPFPDSLTENLIHKAHHGGLLIVLEDRDFLPECIKVIACDPPIYQFFEAFRPDPVPLPQTFQDSRAG